MLTFLIIRLDKLVKDPRYIKTSYMPLSFVYVYLKICIFAF